MNISTTSYLVMVLLTAGFLFLPQATSAQERKQQIDTSKVYKLGEVIITASRYEESPETVGRNVTVITRDEIQNSVHSNIADLLASQQSVHMVGSRQTPGSLQQGFIRNSDSNHSLILIDGVRISDPSTVNNSVDLSEISLMNVERIEIVRGSHSTLYGSSAIGGVVNIITQKRGKEGFNISAETKHGTFGSGTYATTDKAMINYTSSNGFYVRGGAYWKYSNGLDATIDTAGSSGVFNPQDRDDFNKLDVTGKIGYEIDDLDIYASYRREDQTIEVDQGAFNDDSNARTDFKRNLVGYGAAYQAGEYITLNYDGAYSELNRDFLNDSSLVDGQGNFDGTSVETNAHGSLWENDLTAVLEGKYIRSSIGLESRIQSMNFRTYVFSRSNFGVFESTTDLDSLDLKETINSAFVHTEINGGVINEALDAFSLTLGSRMLNHNEFGTHFTFEVNPEFNITPTSLLYGAVTTGFNAPSLFQLNSPEQSFGEQFTIGNSNLEPEESISYEVGWKQSVGDNTRFTLNLFKTRVDNVIEYVYIWNGNTSIDNLGFGDYLGDTYINLSEQSINGMELGLDFRPSSKWSIGGSLTLSSSELKFSSADIDKSYTGQNHVQVFESGKFIEGETEIDGLTRRPEVSATLKVGYRPFPDLKIDVHSRFVGERDDIFFSNNLGPFGALDRSQVDGYNLTDLSLRYQFNSNLSTVISVENLLDTDYVEINGFNTRGRGFHGKIRYEFNAF